MVFLLFRVGFLGYLKCRQQIIEFKGDFKQIVSMVKNYQSISLIFEKTSGLLLNV